MELFLNERKGWMCLANSTGTKGRRHEAMRLDPKRRRHDP
uniref:Uncharacterized protein n=1 Tax=Picea sitchensis TaxID=3332 RepID=A0A6B9XXG6_PICSI|nr:hypothetical protein Q903MT_gene6671 [Picea sitchensis]